MRILAAAVTLSLALATGTAFADGLDPTRISLPSGPGSIEGLGKNFAPSLASGTASYGVDIAVPPGAGGFVPHVSLDYDSSGGVTEIGMGWRLGGVPSIHRRTENGLPKFDATDAFEIRGIGIACDLLQTAPGTYRPEFESGAFVRVQPSRDLSMWEARDKAGVTYRFGGGASYVEAEGTHVAGWLLNQMIDLHGHTIAFTWDTTSGRGLLQQVVWNDYGSDVRNAISFAYAARPDQHVFLSSGIKESLAQRVTTIEVTHGGALVRRYELAYAAGVHSQLASVDLVGRDGTSRMPPLSFAYTQPSFAAAGQVTAMAMPPGRTPADPNIEIADLDGDGLPDLLITLAGQFRSYQNQDGSSWNAGVDWDPSQSPSVQLGTTGVQLADMDGDGALDLVIKSGTDSLQYLPGSSATGFGAAVTIATVPNVTFEDPDVKLVDMDGDRRVDVLVTTPNGIAIGYNLNGVDWTVPSIIGMVDPSQALRFSDGGHTQLCDINGDRVQDFCYLTSGSLVYWLGRGRGVFEPAQTATGVPTWDPSSPWQLRDLDGDGWVDLVHVGVDQVDYALAIAAGTFDAPRTITGTPYRGPNTTVQFADMNGSGTTDIVWVDVADSPATAWQYLELFPQGRAGLLQRVDNGLGKVTTMVYAPAALDAAAARVAGAPWTSRMNVAMPVVKSVSMDASLGDPIVATQYAYRDGAFSAVERTFAGFAGGTETAVGDQYTPTLTTQSTFDVGLVDRTQRGLVLTQVRSDASGTVFDQVATTYTSTTLEPSLDGRVVNYTFKTAEQTTHIEGTTKPRITLVEWQQDAHGNVTRESKWGEVIAGDKLAGGDEAITVRTFAEDTTDWILGRVATDELQDGQGNRVRSKQTFYDGAPFVGLPLGQLVRGDVARTMEWLTADTWELAASTFYDADGNPTETRDARGGGHLFSWDSHDHTSILSESVKVDSGIFTEQATWDAAFGVLLSVLGYNDQVTTLTYDAFGRVATIVRPGDSGALPTLAFTYAPSAPLSRVTTTKRQWVGRTDADLSETVVDGAGRTRASFVAAESGRWVLGSVAFYDARGEARRALRPRWATAADRAAPPLAADAPGMSTWRDALGRTVLTQSQLGIQSRTAYAPFLTQTWDGGQTDASSPYEHTPASSVFDGLGRVVSNAHVLGGTMLAAAFTYDAAGGLLTKMDPDGNYSSYTYDGRGRRVSLKDPDTGPHSWVYDATGNMTEHHKPDGAVVRFTFDLAGRALTEDWGGGGNPDVAHIYDQSPRHPGSPLYRGVPVSTSGPSGTIDHEIDERRRVTAIHYTIGADTFDVGSAYDDEDREYLHVYPDTSSLRINYNARGLVAGYGAAVTVAYDGDGVELQRSFNTGVGELHGYDDDRRRVESRATGASGSILQDLQWTYDSAANIVAIGDLRSGVTADKDRSEKYTYDNLYRLVGASGTWGSTQWSYSQSGSLLSRVSTEPSQNAGTMSYGLNAGPHAMTAFGGRTIRYDAAGRMLADGNRTYTWNAADQLVHVEDANGNTVDSLFDGDGTRRSRVEHAATGDTHTTKFIDPWSEVKDGQLVRFIAHGGRRIARLASGNGTPAVAGATAENEATEPRGAGASRLARLVMSAPTTFVAFAMLTALVGTYRRRLLAFAKFAGPVLAVALGAACSPGADDGAPPPILNGTIQTLGDADDLLFDDAIGSLTEETTGTGTPKSSSAAYPYGLPRYDTSPETNKYAGTPRDGSVGVDQMGVRTYVPELGVFASVDPVRLSKPERGASGSFALDHGYAYAALTPVMAVDRTGRQAYEEFARYQAIMQPGNPLVSAMGDVANAYVGVVEAPYDLVASTLDMTLPGVVMHALGKAPSEYLSELKPALAGVDRSSPEYHMANMSAGLALSMMLPMPGLGVVAEETEALGLAFNAESKAVQAAEGGGFYGHLEDHRSVGPGKEYTGTQKQRTLQANKERNGGQIRDDVTGEALVAPLKHQKGVTPPSNEAHVDHYYPRSQGGPNSYRNANVRSRANNLDKGNKIE